MHAGSMHMIVMIYNGGRGTKKHDMLVCLVMHEVVLVSYVYTGTNPANVMPGFCLTATPRYVGQGVAIC